ncbi:ABC transporter ATP-binding protein [Kitasatospora phosalacinea]|uniref:ABC transporter ATP-binding protein n=1 Tax=Kitasatospora phosalacinea TaxID=2065 RepID=UPI0035DA3360
MGVEAVGVEAVPDLEELRRRASGEGRPPAEGMVVCENLVRIHRSEGVEVQALQGLDLVVEDGELIAVVGASGSGKSTLLGILAGLDVPTAGSARVAGHDLLAMGKRERLEFRRRTVGFVWQQTARNLLPYLTAAENVMLPMGYAGVPRGDRRRQAGELLELLGIGHLAGRRPAEMSGGEQQRVAIAVANANSPALLLADEPTGELDSATSEEIFAALRSVNEELGVTVLIVTHDLMVAQEVRRTVRIRNGRTSTEVLRPERGEPGVEYAVLDRVGRLQLPPDFTEALQLSRRVRLALEEDHIGVWRAEEEVRG